MRVISVNFKNDSKIYRLANQRLFRTHRYCCLGPGDDIIIYGPHDAYAKCRNGRAQIFPAYSRRDTLIIGTRTLSLNIKEIETEEELAGYNQLEEYHYRGKILHGRRVPLIVRSEDPLLPLVLGYIELSTTFIMNQPRAKLLDTDFCDPNGDISWTAWKKKTVRQYTNLLVRIARTVISPEFRGLGLARVLVKHAVMFARDHWHVGKLRPLFLEITADMLRYVPFVESSGMHYIGDTEGNLARVNRDMEYVLKNFARVKTREILKEESAGIVDLQVSYATYLKQIERDQGVPRKELLQLLLRSPHRLSDENWAMLHRIFRLPKPTFLMGLIPLSEELIRRRVHELRLPKRYPVQRPCDQKPRLTLPVEVKNCTLTLSAPLIRTRATRKIQQAFGVNRDMLTTTLFTDISFVIKPGDIILICGPSGAGKTTLLSLIQRRLLDPDYSPSDLTGVMIVPQHATISSLGPLSSTRPLVNSLGRVTFERALFALNVSGLAEAHLYVKRFCELSNGQRYRAMVAKLIASDADIWIADEFCSALDPITANIVSRNLHRCAKQLGITCILAAANWGEFVHELRPDTIVHLRAPWDYRVFSWGEFTHAFSGSEALGHRVRGISTRLIKNDDTHES